MILRSPFPQAISRVRNERPSHKRPHIRQRRPRGVSIGDSLDTLLSPTRAPTPIPENTGDLTGEQSNEEMILYCAMLENQTA